MSVCRKHRQHGKRTCTCPRTRTIRSDGYGGPDVSLMSEIAFDSLSDNATGGYGSTSYDSGSSSSGSYDSGSSYGGGSSSSYDSGGSSSSGE